ncbi:MAG: DUF1559 domain-containing protein [Planctomycetes bacterium]|nr:DUF1559 domain-containing protein [Planctomycetota bacterium]
MKRFTPRGAAGFTMIELLAVLAIVLTLSAILFPAIENARAKSLQTKSLQNVRSLGQALIQYEADRGHYPAGELVFDGQDSTGTAVAIRQRWMNALAPYMGSDERAITDAQGRAGGDPNDVNGASGDRDQTVFNKGFADPAAGGWEIGRNNSIGYNYQYLGDARERLDSTGPAAPIVNGQPVRGFVNYPVTRAQIPRPDKTIAFGSSDGTGGYSPYRSPSTSLPPTSNDGAPGTIGQDGLAQLGNDGFLLDPTFLPLRDLNNDGVLDQTNDIAGAAGSRGAADQRHCQAARSVLSNRHNGGATVVFVDGHAEWVLREDAYRDKDTGAFSNALWNGFGRDNDANGNGRIDPLEGERVLDANEAFAAGQTDISQGVCSRNLQVLNALGSPQLVGSFQGYGPGFDTQSTPFRGERFGPTLPKVPPLEPPRGNARANRTGP